MVMDWTEGGMEGGMEGGTGGLGEKGEDTREGGKEGTMEGGEGGGEGEVARNGGVVDLEGEGCGSRFSEEEGGGEGGREGGGREAYGIRFDCDGVTAVGVMAGLERPHAGGWGRCVL